MVATYTRNSVLMWLWCENCRETWDHMVYFTADSDSWEEVIVIFCQNCTETREPNERQSRQIARATE